MRRGALMMGGVAAVVAQLAGCASPGGPGSTANSQNAVQREQIEWCDTWVTEAPKDDLPRVLLIGDSITRAYFKDVENHLQGKAHCARVTTSKCIGDPFLLPEIQLLLAQYRFKVVHVNNGMHGWSYSEEQYGQAFGAFMETLAKDSHGARLIWAHTTPVMVNGNPANERTQRVKSRNRIAAEFADQRHIPIDDLFGLVVDHPEYYSTDGVHLNKQGVEAQARQVAGCILKALEDSDTHVAAGRR